MLASYSSSDLTDNLPVTNVLPPDELETTIQPLSPATKYKCEVKARTQMGVGSSAELMVWTEANGESDVHCKVIVHCKRS